MGETNLTFVATLSTLLFCSLYIHSQTTSITSPLQYDTGETDWRPAPRPLARPAQHDIYVNQNRYARPTPRPTARPVAKPSATPKAAPQAVPGACADDATWYYGHDKSKNCKHVAGDDDHTKPTDKGKTTSKTTSKTTKRCQNSDGTRTGLEACPATCGACDSLSMSYAPTSLAAFSHKPTLRPTRKPHAYIRYDDDENNDVINIEEVPGFPWWRLTLGVVALGGLAWVFTKATLDGAYERLSRTAPLVGAAGVFSGSSEYERV